MPSVLAAWGAVLGLAVAGAALAQQNIPRRIEEKGLPPELLQRIPGSAPPAPKPAGEDRCSLLQVGDPELRSLRSVILEQLANDERAQAEFLKAEAKVPADCIRVKAVFYLRVLAKVRKPG
jgi:hypothetical protein